MSQSDLTRFRRMCGQFRWLAVFMVVSVGLLLASVHLVFPALNWAINGRAMIPRDTMASLIWITPAAFYLFAVWSIGTALGQIAKGRLIQPTLASALRHVGLALGLGGVFTVFLMTNLLRLTGAIQGGFLNVDIGGMTLGMIGGALFLLGRVIDQAGAIQSELDEII
ncbi:MAG: DUF2975 domain-containing protein [Brevundimonas sp.]|nr:MAG: DUF2975 domain-containing protein [Brevundimonas sp.]